MSPVSAIQPAIKQTSLTKNEATAPTQLIQPQKNSSELKEAFQDFVAGTFYKQMFKALRSGQNKPAYFHGGQAEELFQSHMDQQISEDLAKQHGSVLSDTLFSTFARQMNAVSVDSLKLSSGATS
ncbi:rod-binding protein [Gimesia aquarii]|uniref:Rod binding protein n=1 Tax=Gimesia aquarii TaxID=2527964 RepID=A0A517W2D5_9PLAN|nr:rod-binding protein [Gimesia aquarii]QDT99435.1 Rod binding protein [Gimesia aquarii]